MQHGVHTDCGCVHPGIGFRAGDARAYCNNYTMTVRRIIACREELDRKGNGTVDGIPSEEPSLAERAPGCVSEEQIGGKSVFRACPLNAMGIVGRRVDYARGTADAGRSASK